MLSSSGQRIRDDIERFHAAEAAEPVLPGPHPARRRDGRGVDDPPVAVVAGTWSAILLDLFGAVVVGLAISAATALGRLLWRRPTIAAWPGHHLGSAGEPDGVGTAPYRADDRNAAAFSDLGGRVDPSGERHGADHVVRPVLERRRLVANTQAAPP